MSYEIQPYSSSHLELWEQFVASAINGNFLNSRKFLSYHRDRFADKSLLVYKDGKLTGVLASAVSLDDSLRVVSHPGVTYGGLIHQGKLRGQKNLEALSVIARYYNEQGFQKFTYKSFPMIYSKIPAQDDLYSLFRMGARRTVCNLSCSIDLNRPWESSERRQRSLKKALKSVVVLQDMSDLKAFWQILEENLSREHGAKPVHSFSEIEELIKLFPENLRILTAQISGSVVAGVLLFVTNQVWHCQYIAANTQGYEVSALDAVFNEGFKAAQNQGARFFDFGTSNTDGGKILNDGLYQFKAEFGGGGVAYEVYELDLK